MDDIKLLHCLPKFQYLLEALQSGLMMTPHSVSFKFSDTHDDYIDIINLIKREMEIRLRSVGVAFDTLQEENKQMLFTGTGSIQGYFPMLCFTEIRPGRDISLHRACFGEYGIVPTNNWTISNNADRVLYVGQGASFGKLLYTILGLWRASYLGLSNDSRIIFTNPHFNLLLNLISMVEIRSHIEEAEWRIAGNHGFIGGKADSGKRIPLGLKDIEFILVPSVAGQATTESTINAIATHTNYTGSLPKILISPISIPFA